MKATRSGIVVDGVVHPETNGEPMKFFLWGTRLGQRKNFRWQATRSGRKS
ncbi:hypothetical protein HRbin15_02221 [bacterium HR15]|nr:hypothetical protein HRbin15_02221 [bacterium HR15]